MSKKSKANQSSFPVLELGDAIISLPLIDEAESLANQIQKSDEELAHEYAAMMDAIYVDALELDATVCVPDRRLYKGNREAWVYERGNVAELVFVR